MEHQVDGEVERGDCTDNANWKALCNHHSGCMCPLVIDIRSIPGHCHQLRNRLINQCGRTFELSPSKHHRFTNFVCHQGDQLSIRTNQCCPDAR